MLPGNNTHFFLIKGIRQYEYTDQGHYLCPTRSAPEMRRILKTAILASYLLSVRAGQEGDIHARYERQGRDIVPPTESLAFHCQEQ